jgi:RES domain-containing protein/uncharacterized protein (DUF2384 family)
MSVTVTDDQKATRRAKALVRTAKPETSSKKVVIKVKSPAKFRDVFNASPEDRIKIIRRGMPATEAKRIVQVLGLEHKFFYHALGLKTATVNRKIALSEQLSSDESERLLGVAKLIGQVEAIIAESGDPNDFNASEWISRWLREPLPAFGGDSADRAARHDGRPGDGGRSSRPDSKRSLCVSHSLWRIASDTRDYTADDLSGKGAEITGGRWNDRGTPVVYTSCNRALAALETIVHLNAGGLPLNRYLIEIIIPDDVWAQAQACDHTIAPVGWDSEPASRTSSDFGTNWARSNDTLLLRVPSVIVPEEQNVLINPRHRDLTKISARKIRKWIYDPRMLKA